MTMKRTLRNLVRLWMALAILLGLVASAQADMSVKVNGIATTLPSPTGDQSTWVGAWGRLTHFDDGDDRIFVQIANYSNADFQWAYYGTQGTDSTKRVVSEANGSTISTGYPCSVDSDCKRSYEVCGGPILGCTDISRWQASPYSCAVDTDCPTNFGCRSGTLNSGSSTMACMCNNNAACGPDRYCYEGTCFSNQDFQGPFSKGSTCPTSTTPFNDYCAGPSCSTDSDCSAWRVVPSCNTTAYAPAGICNCSKDTDCAGMGFNTPKCQQIPYMGTLSHCVEGGSAPTTEVYSPWGNQPWEHTMLATRANSPPSALSAIFSFNHTDSYYNPSIHLGFTPVFHNDDGTTSQGSPLELQIWVKAAPSALLNDIKMAFDILKLTVSAIVAPEMDVKEALKFIYDSLDEADKITQLAGSIDMSSGADSNHFNAGIVAPGDGLDSTSQFPSYSQMASSPTNRIDVIVYHPNFPEGSVGAHAHAQYIQIYTVMDDCDQMSSAYCQQEFYDCLPNSPNSHPTYGGNNAACNAYFTDPDSGVLVVNKLVMNIHSYAQFAAYFATY